MLLPKFSKGIMVNMKARKVISVLAATFVMINAGVAPRAVSEEKYAVSDIDSHWAEDDITTLTEADILRGSNGKANPDNNITRGEFAALVARTLSLEASVGQSFGDVPVGHMFHNEVSAAAEAGIIKGVGGGNFAPDMNITREQIMLMISRCVEGSKSANISFADIAKNYAYTTELKKAVATGIITGFEDNTFRPYANATRAECSAMLTRLLKSDSDISKQNALELSEKYITNDMKNPKNNLSISTGRANEEISLKLTAQESISSNSVYVQKLLSNLELIEFESDGSLASALYTGDITYVLTSKDNSKHKAYTAEFNVDMIEKDGTLYVYNYDMSLKKKERINLTWEVYSTPPEYAPEGVNVVSPSSFQVSAEDLGVESKSLMSGAKFYNSLTRKYMDYAEQNGYEVWPIYKTDFSLKTSDALLNSTEARQTALGYLIDYACKYFIDGINFDFENVYERNRHLLTKHVRDASVMLHELGLVVSVDITRREPTSSNWSMCYDRDALCDNADYIMLMAYDEYYASSKTAGSVASLDWTEDSIKKTLNEVTADKLVLGIPFYMRYFEVTGTKVTSSKAISMQTAYDLIQANNPTYTYMESDEQYKISWKSGNKTCIFWLENSDTIAKRVQLANDYSLAGVASWRRGLEVSKIWSVINENLN